MVRAQNGHSEMFSAMGSNSVQAVATLGFPTTKIFSPTRLITLSARYSTDCGIVRPELNAFKRLNDYVRRYGVSP